MKLQEALTSAQEGNFLSNNNFSSNESLHYYEGNYYYEDGAILNDETIVGIENSNWGNEGWYIKYPKEKVDVEILSKTHRDNCRKMLHDKSYENCIQHDIIKDVIYNDDPPSKYDYKFFTVSFDNAPNKEFHYHIKNPIPTKDEIIGKSYYELREICTKMWYDAISNVREVNSKE